MDDGPGGYERSYFHLKHKFDQLQSSHDRLLRLNQELEEKMLSLVQRFDAEKACLVCRADATVARVGALVDENSRLLQANERYKADVLIATQLLRCKPASFSALKLESLPQDLQVHAKQHMRKTDKTKSQTERKARVIRVPVSAFPSTTVIYSVTSSDEEQENGTDISPALIARVLEERQKEVDSGAEEIFADPKRADKGTQTTPCACSSDSNPSTNGALLDPGQAKTKAHRCKV